MDNQLNVRPFVEADAVPVRALFIKVNRALAPADLKAAFESYIELSLREEIDRISEYYGERNGGFWVALIETQVVGMFGLEQSGPGAMELRRVYVDPDRRRLGIGGKLLQFAEDQCRADNLHRLDLSTSETQPDALSLYRNSGFELVREEVAEAANNKTIGGGIRRYHFKKEL
ncbi:MAG: GNAT family N-acetyltransferase [Rhodospirillales bacterium]|nr:GNAT family N-acetyltransferase [Rhodospirillales bacterium]